jgi:adenosylcobinamide-GDP ribazoletransferase
MGEERPGLLARLVAPPLAALQFLTVTPPLVRRAFSLPELGRAVGYFPLVGALLGGVLVAFDWALSFLFPAGVRAALDLALWVALTGALHLDGVLDACDGLFGGRTVDSRLEIMRDERVGAFGLAGGVVLLLLKVSALAATPQRPLALFLAPVAGRWGISFVLVTSPYARPQGLGRAMKDHAGWVELALATTVALVAAILAGGWWGLTSLAVAGAVAWLAARFVRSRLPGLTGDVYGAICELVETVVLLALAAQVGG